jgi:hypothetical protein
VSQKENVDIARKAHEAFNRPDLGVFDLDAFYQLADPHFVVDCSRSNGLEAGIYRGEATTRRFWNTFFEAFERVVVEPLGSSSTVSQSSSPTTSTHGVDRESRWTRTRP